ncbi:uncharacterized protein LOC112556455 [Pomacea canaliculata]|uniref:uncharacterized protein LOC112556455 n=1 Tax=Pomacea canaliculata TaxID=400727 RepID=UPI000D73B98D|nr:uncharacterized protein LOC112556455 [Pomacea canaliculata]
MLTCKMDAGRQRGGQGLYRAQNEALMKDRQTFREKLQEFPNLFQLKDYSELTMERKQNMLDRLKSEIIDESNYHTPKEVTCISNLIAFLLFLTKDVEKAVEETNKVLTSPDNDTNVVALANMAVMTWERGKRVEGEKMLKKLQELRNLENFQQKVTDAKGEMAYSYSRMGMTFAALAVDTFEEVVQSRPLDYTWKLGLALVLRRFTHINYRMHFRISSDLTSQRSLRAFDLLLEIRNSDAPEGQRAQALVELGMLLEQWWNAEMSSVIERAKEKGITAEKCYEEAVQLAPEDVYVLAKCGKFFKIKNKLDKSREILERAIAIRPTTTAHHYLGNTFVRMAIWQQKNQSKQFDRKTNITDPSHQELSNRMQRMAVEEPHSSQQANTEATAAYVRIIKSPKRLLSMSLDQYVEKALYHFEESIRLSCKENSPAVYDLGLLYVSLGDDDKALDQFYTLINETGSRASPVQIINAHEQSGFLLLKKSSSANDENDKENYASEACRLLQDALQMQCQVVSSLPDTVPNFKTLWPSFYELCNAAKTSSSPDRQMKEMAKLFEMIKNYAECLDVLDEMSKFSPQETVDPEFLEQRLNCYVNLKRYDDALLFLSMLETTKEEELVRQWSDPHLAKRVRVMAAREKLLKTGAPPSASIDDKTIKRCFVQVIQSDFSQTDEETQRKYVDDGCSENLERKWWHVMILHDLYDDDMKAKGLTIKNILQNVCGLRVTCMSDDDDVRPYDHELWTIHENAEKSQIFLVLCGTKDFSDEFYENFLQVLPEMCSGDTTRKPILALQLDNVPRPKKLHPHRWFQCPPSLFGTPDLYTPELIDDICNLFCFLADITIDIE